MLRLIPEADVKVIERCSGHGGSWGFKREFRGRDEGRPARWRVRRRKTARVSSMSECPLAGVHIAQGIEKQTADGPRPILISHPVQLLARAYGFGS